MFVQPRPGNVEQIPKNNSIWP